MVVVEKIPFFRALLAGLVPGANESGPGVYWKDV